MPPERSPAPAFTLVPSPHTDLPQSSLARALSPVAIAHARAAQHQQHEQQDLANEDEDAAVARSAGSPTAAVARSAGSVTAAVAPGDLADAARAATAHTGQPALPPGSPYLNYDMLSPRSRQSAASAAAAVAGSHPGSPPGGGTSHADSVAAEESAGSAALAAAPIGDDAASSVAPYSPYTLYSPPHDAKAWPPHHPHAQPLPERLASPVGVGAEDSQGGLGDLPPGAARSPPRSPARSPSPGPGGGAGGEWTPGTAGSSEAGQALAAPDDRHSYPFPYIVQPSQTPQLPPAVVYLHPSVSHNSGVLVLRC